MNNYEEELKKHLERATPKNILNKRAVWHNIYLGECPQCGTTNDFLEHPFTCRAKGCRQALNWSKDEQVP